MGETRNTLEEMNESQRRTIHRQVLRIQTLEQWEKFASYLLNNCIGEVVTEENLEQWLAKAQETIRI